MIISRDLRSSRVPYSPIHLYLYVKKSVIFVPSVHAQNRYLTVALA
eukprot:SAG11_NODE_18821_length_480_cov_1.551181_2_plen_45_part_01